MKHKALDEIKINRCFEFHHIKWKLFDILAVAFARLHLAMASDRVGGGAAELLDTANQVVNTAAPAAGRALQEDLIKRILIPPSGRVPVRPSQGFKTLSSFMEAPFVAQIFVPVWKGTEASHLEKRLKMASSNFNSLPVVSK